MKIQFPLFILLAVALVACNIISGSNINQTDSTETGCIPPQIFAYQTNQEATIDIPQFQPVLPLLPWQETEVLPEFPIDSQGVNKIQFVIPKDGYSEIWISRQWKYKEDTEFDNYQIIVYSTDINKWRSVIGQIHNTNKGPDIIFLSNDKKVWGLSNWMDGSGNTILSQYNTESEEFELIQDSNNILNGDFFGFSYEKPPLLDQYGTFWLVKLNGLYSFNPVTYKSNQYLIDYQDTNSYLMDSFAIAQDGSIYVLLENARELIHFYPDTGKYDRVKVQLNLPPSLEIPNGLNADSLFMDHSGRLWINDYGWKQQTDSWHQIVSRFPVFFSKPNEIPYFHWELPFIVLESSNKILWFRSQNGMVSLDPEKGEWCWFTTYQSNIIEDSNHNLWMIADGKLYKKP